MASKIGALIQLSWRGDAHKGRIQSRCNICPTPTSSDKYLHVDALAKNLGIEAEYRIVNMLLSKFTHTTGLSVILPFATETTVATARESFLLLGAMNALHTINRLSDYAHIQGLPPLDN